MLVVMMKHRQVVIVSDHF